MKKNDEQNKVSGKQSWFEKFGKKKSIGITIGVIAVFVVGVGIYYMSANADKLKLNNDLFIVEYGESISDNAKDYVTANEAILKDTKIDVTYENEKEKEYPAVGSYEGSATYKKEQHQFKVEVKDTKAPEFKDFKKEVKIEQNAEDVKLPDYFKAEDLSEVKITVEDKEVDLSKTGEYKVKVTATDAYDNKTTEEATIVVVEADKADEVTETTEGTKPQSADTKQKKEEQAKAEEEQQQQTITGGGSSSGNAGSGGNTSGGATQPAPQPQPNGIGAVINTAYSFVGRTDMSCNDLVIQSYVQNGYNVLYGSAYYLGYSVGTDTSILQVGDVIIISNHAMLVSSVNGATVEVIEGGIGGGGVVQSSFTRKEDGLYYFGSPAKEQVIDIRRL